jgi:hypothetical protein
MPITISVLLSFKFEIFQFLRQLRPIHLFIESKFIKGNFMFKLRNNLAVNRLF